MHQPPQRNPRPASAGKKILKFGCLPAFVLLVALIALGSAVDNGDEPSDKADSSAMPAARESAPPLASDLPPKPDLATRTAYLADLDAIDPDIVHGKDDKAVSRGRNQCSDFKTTVDGEKLSREKMIANTNYRFTSPDHPNGHGTEIAEQILDVVHKHLCPKF